jgi:hypothetical protein
MKALTWHGKNDIRCDSVPDPKIEHGRDAIIKVTACAICGSDLHLFDGVMPTMEKGDVLGHETMGEVVEVGSENERTARQDSYGLGHQSRAYHFEWPKPRSSITCPIFSNVSRRARSNRRSSSPIGRHLKKALSSTRRSAPSKTDASKWS